MTAKLKPLFANLKRLKLGGYLNTKEFDLFTLERNIDETWENCKREISKNKTFFVLGYHNTEEEEEAFMLILNHWYKRNLGSFTKFILTVLLNFAKWNEIKVDFSGVINNLEQIGISKDEISSFSKSYKKIQRDKPSIENEKKIIEQVNSFIDKNKIFVVHGKDDPSRLELCKLLKNDFKLEPIVLQDEPNNNIETIISKFERLASECAVAIILFTPDDEAGDYKRARQNVIFELGYFLGRFQNKIDRRIIILKKGNIEIPSDISGVIYIEYARAVKEVFYDLKKQFEYWGYTF